jgi:predicted MPP superfamily phosphohydrolase
VIWLLVGLALVAAALAWSVFEAGWVRLETIEARLPGLPTELDGLRVAHLSDFHLGFPSRGGRAVERAIDWVATRKPDLVLVSGDLLSRPSGEVDLRRLLARLEHCYVVLGNHDFALSRDPFTKPSAVFDLEPATVILDEARSVTVRGAAVQIVGVDPRSYDRREAEPDRLADPEADLRICLCHFPGISERIAPGSFDLICAGHVHDGQIAIPYPGGKLRFAHLRHRQGRGLLRRPSGLLHISAGLGTTFVPFRFFARPEATELVLREQSEAPPTQGAPLPN